MQHDAYCNVTWGTGKCNCDARPKGVTPSHILAEAKLMESEHIVIVVTPKGKTIKNVNVQAN